MRITCPNCGAQYEVEEALIPEAGRDVQCSNCGKGWFQPKQTEPAAAETPESPEVGETRADEHESVHEDVTDEVAPSEEAGEAEAESETANEAELEATARAAEDAAAPEADAPAAREEDDLSAETEELPPAAAAAESRPVDAAKADDYEDEEASGPARALPPRNTDENVLAVLREEAEREIAKRREEAASIEFQPDLGLAEPTERKPSQATAETAAGAAISAGARRDLLPDIDEINSTLRSDADRHGADHDESDEAVASGRRRGFRMGFGLMILLAAALIGLYVGSAWLAATVPALEPFLIAYVEWANGLGVWLDGLLAAGVDGLSGLMEDDAPGA